MKTLAAAAVVVAAIALVWYLHRPASTTAASVKPAAAAPPAEAVSPKPARPPAHVTKLSPEERTRLAERIAQAQATRGGAATRAPAAPKLPDRPGLDPDDVDSFKTTIRSAMKEVIPLLADCYAKAGSSVPRELTVRAHLRLTGDPDIGTLIDADRTSDTDEAPLPAAFDDCLRSTLQSLAAAAAGRRRPGRGDLPVRVPGRRVIRSTPCAPGSCWPSSLPQRRQPPIRTISCCRGSRIASPMAAAT
jgi:hypothetical protein